MLRNNQWTASHACADHERKVMCVRPNQAFIRYETWGDYPTVEGNWPETHCNNEEKACMKEPTASDGDNAWFNTNKCQGDEACKEKCDT